MFNWSEVHFFGSIFYEIRTLIGKLYCDSILLGKLVHNDVLKKLVLVGGWNDVVDVSITVVVVVVDQEKV